MCVCVCVRVCGYSERERVCFAFMANQTLKVIHFQIYFYTNKQFCFKQFNLPKIQSLILKNISISSSSVQSNSSISNNST